MRIQRIDVAAWDVPMRSPYRSAQRVTTTAHNAWARLRLDDGSVGFGESAPARYVTGETQGSVVAAAREAIGELIGREVREAEALLADRLAQAPGARGMLETALADAAARAEGVPLCRYLGAGGDSASEIVTDLSLPILPPDEARSRAGRAASEGFRSLKVKVGCGDPDEDVRRVRAVAAGAPSATLRLDGNQAFADEQAVRFFDRLWKDAALAERIELFEQPTPAADAAALRRVSERVPVPVYADESARSPEAAAELVGSGACRGVVLKLAKTGLRETAEVARAVRAAGGRFLFGCMMETRIAIGAAMHLALALGVDDMRFDLDGHLLVDDTARVTGGLRQEADRLLADPAASGLGLVAVSSGVL